ncbi:MAG: hypothetical protein IJL17_09940 [Kiritimatiellae bacterium]|nr:hypothetical protein [Kiritimatiellia bacterium]
MVFTKEPSRAWNWTSSVPSPGVRWYGYPRPCTAKTHPGQFFLLKSHQVGVHSESVIPLNTTIFDTPESGCPS